VAKETVTVWCDLRAVGRVTLVEETQSIERQYLFG